MIVVVVFVLHMQTPARTAALQLHLFLCFAAAVSGQVRVLG